MKTCGERHPLQPLPETAGIPFAMLGERNVGQTGVLAREAPCRFAMPGKIDGGVIHEIDPTPKPLVCRWLCQPVGRAAVGLDCASRTPNASMHGCRGCRIAPRKRTNLLSRIRDPFSDGIAVHNAEH